MIELIPTLTTTIALANKLREIGDKLKHAELKDVIGDLRLQLADLKIGAADLLEENDALKRQLASLQNADGDPCPKCRSRSYHVQDSKKHPKFGAVGGILRTYMCDSCQFSEDVTIMPR